MKGPTKSAALAAEKARELRVQRLRHSLDTRLDNPMAAIDALMAEAGDGDLQPELWERLHAAATRDSRTGDLAEAYRHAAKSPRMRRLDEAAQACVLLHGADFFRGVLGDPDGEGDFLERVVAIIPGHADAFPRLERRLEKLGDDRRLVELYSAVVFDPPRPPPVIATQALHRLVRVQPQSPVADEVLRRLVVLAGGNPKLLNALDAHCRATKRFGLACDLIERAIAVEEASGAASDLVHERRKRLVELCFGEAAAPARAIDQVEHLLDADPRDAFALKAADRLMSQREVASRAAAALQQARRARNSERPPPSRG